MKITVVGSGFVGQTAAMRLLEKGLGEVCLIDIIEGKPEGIALDLKQAAAIEGYEPTIVGTNDYADTEGSDLVVITAGFPRQPGMSRMDLLGKNAAIMRDVIANVVARLARHDPDRRVEPARRDDLPGRRGERPAARSGSSAWRASWIRRGCAGSSPRSSGSPRTRSRR